MVPIFSDPKGFSVKGIIKHIRKKIQDLECQLETITPADGAIQTDIDFEKINQTKEEIEMLKNELLTLENDSLDS